MVERYYLMHVVFCFMLWIMLPYHGNAQSTGLLTISRIEGTIELDGMPNEAGWQPIRSLPMVMYLPESGNTPTEKSDIRIGYDDEYLYIGARLYDFESLAQKRHG